LKSVRKLKDWELLDLAVLPIADGDLAHLHTLKNLKQIRLSFTCVTAEGIAELQKALPNAKIIEKELCCPNQARTARRRTTGSTVGRPSVAWPPPVSPA
jgi:hypothetical protein